MRFKIINEDNLARTGRISLRRGEIQTPAFMPVGTYGAVKSVTPEELRSQLILPGEVDK